jgi:hypothetical protein
VGKCRSPTTFYTANVVTGHDIDSAREVSKDIYEEFRDVLQAKSKLSNDCDELLKAWNFADTLTLPMAQILQHPTSLIRVFYRFIYPKLFQENRKELVPRFQKFQELAARVRSSTALGYVSSIQTVPGGQRVYCC